VARTLAVWSAAVPRLLGCVCAREGRARDGRPGDPLARIVFHPNCFKAQCVPGAQSSTNFHPASLYGSTVKTTLPPPDGD